MNRTTTSAESDSSPLQRNTLLRSVAKHENFTQTSWEINQYGREVTCRLLALLLGSSVVFRIAVNEIGFFFIWAELICFFFFLVCAFSSRVRNHTTIFSCFAIFWSILYLTGCIGSIMSLYKKTSYVSGFHVANLNEMALSLALRVTTLPISSFMTLISAGTPEEVVIVVSIVTLLSSSITLAFVAHHFNPDTFPLILRVLFPAVFCWISCFGTVIVGERRRRTLQAQIEEERRRNQDRRSQEDQLDEQKQRVISYIFHEVRNPISNIALAADLARDLSKKSGCDKNLAFLIDSICRASDAARFVLEDALHFQRLQAGTFEFTHRAFPLVESHLSCLKMIEPQLQHQGIRYSHIVDERIRNIIVGGDARRINQVLSNFFSNAMKFTNRGGEIKLIISELGRGETISESGQRQDTIKVRTAVTNTGLGIAEEDKHKIFKPWSQIRARDQQSGRGSGLGLALCKDFIEKGHNGTINFESRPGVLTTFYFEIEYPICQQPDVPLSPMLAQRLIQSRWSDVSLDVDVQEDDDDAEVLVVDDSKVSRNLLCKTLDTFGLTYTTCADGKQAVEKIIGVSPIRCRVVFMDQEMPVMDGLQASKLLREHMFPGKIVGITGNTSEDQIAAFIKAGADRVLSKPITRDMISETLVLFGIIRNSSSSGASSSSVCRRTVRNQPFG
eukprot:c8511_g1_i2.p1 GENE.c8511_g1_i2~~c8511_g1_i2.p1  ORF type:complete len:674 (+),score=99.73 c8511_g1_i2:133-2154(+)